MRDVPHDRGRGAVEMQHEIVGCCFKPFMEHYMPSVPGRNSIRKVVDHLVERGVLLVDGNRAIPRYAWKDFPTAPSQMEKQTEDRIFQKMEPICEAISSLTLGGRTSTLVYVDGPFKTTASEIGGATHKMDGTMKLRESLALDLLTRGSTKVLTADVAVNMEYKVESDPKKVSKNRTQLLGGALHIKHNDPARSHNYSLSIEDDHVTVWYWSPSHSAVADTFSFIDKPVLLVHVLTSFLFATKEELGYLPAVDRAVDPETNQICYLYTTPGTASKLYKTIDCLYEKHTLSFTGRSPRVWTVVEVASKTDLTAIGPQRVLKDYWLDKGEPTEQQIQDAIFSDFASISDRMSTLPAGEGEFAGVHEQTAKSLRECFKDEHYKDYFLKIQGSGVIAESKPVPTSGIYEPGDILHLHLPVPKAMRASGLPRSSRDPPVSVYSGVTPYDDASSFPSHNPTPWEPPRPFRPKERHLLVYEDVCTVLHELPSLHEVFSVMLDCLLALQLLALAGWMHRDISSGNLFGYKMKVPGKEVRYQGKLGDLEFSKKKHATVDVRKDPKTGTPFFMAVEVLLQDLFGEESNPRTRHLLSFDTSQSDWTASLKKINDKEPVQHHVVHDVESFFWLVAWFLFIRVENKSNTKGLEFASRMFQNGGGCSRERLFFLKNAKRMAKTLEMLNPLLHLRPLGEAFESARSFLMDYYLKRNAKNLSDPPPLVGEVFDSLRLLISYARVGTSDPKREIPYTPHVRPVPAQGYDSASGDAEGTGDTDDDDDCVLAPTASDGQFRFAVAGKAEGSGRHSSTGQSDGVPSSLGKRLAEDPEPVSSADGSVPTSGPRKKARPKSRRQTSAVSPSPAPKGSRIGLRSQAKKGK